MGNICSNRLCSDITIETRTIGTSTEIDYHKVKIKTKKNVVLPSIPESESNQI